MARQRPTRPTRTDGRAPSRATRPEPPAAEGQTENVARARAESRASRLAQREELRRQQQAANARRKWVPWVLLGLLALAAVGWFAYNVATSPSGPPGGTETFTNLSREHVPGPQTYPQVPPAGGPHAGVWAKCGIYDAPVVAEQAVHAMEHGAVWITYRPDLPASEVQALRGLVRSSRQPAFVLLSPWGPDSSLPSPIVASAWGYQLKVDSTSDQRLAQFVNRFANGSQTPEPGARCDNGVGTPIETL